MVVTYIIGQFVIDTAQVDEGYVRLAAAEGLLRLARRHDGLIAPAIYVQTALTIQVMNMEVGNGWFSGCVLKKQACRYKV